MKTYSGWTYTWHKGKLSAIRKSTTSSASSTSRAFIGDKSWDYTFTYNAQGQRTQKKYTYFPGSLQVMDYMSSCTTAYEYDLHGRLLSDTRTLKYNDGTIITKKFVFIYEESEIVGVIFTNSSGTGTYYYDKNPRGDVIGILDNSGNTVVKYTYDAWGNCTRGYTTNHDLADNNPIRYRSYYYDEDTGLYYLNARYYNPEWRRFISPDDTAYLDVENANGLNLYAYCGNDPVNYADPSGNSLIISWLIGLGVAAAIGAGIGAASYAAGQVFEYVATGDFEWSWGDLINETASGMVAGITSYCFRKLNSGLLVSFLAGFTSDATVMGLENLQNKEDHAFIDIVRTAMVSGVFSSISARVMGSIKISGLNTGRGNYSAISSQMYTKFYRGKIRGITLKTLGKMYAIESYNSIGEFLIDKIYM